MNKIFDNYLVSACGDIYSLKSKKFLKPYKAKRNYKMVSFRVEGKTIKMLWHRAVALAFMGPSDLTVDHSDNNKLNNTIFNLRYMSAIDNHKKASIDGAIKKGTKHYASKLTEQQILNIRRSKGSQRSIGQMYGIDQSVVSRIKNFKTYAKT